MRGRIWLWIVLPLGLALFFVAVAEAQGEAPTDDQVNAVAKKLYCPVCPNTPLDVCATKACQDWRAQIRDQLAAGWSEAEIIDYFVAQYGERVLAEPERRGFTSLIWILPMIAAAAGLIGLVAVVRQWKRPSPHGAPAAAAYPEVAPEVLERIEEELRKIT